MLGGAGPGGTAGAGATGGTVLGTVLQNAVAAGFQNAQPDIAKSIDTVFKNVSGADTNNAHFGQ